MRLTLVIALALAACAASTGEPAAPAPGKLEMKQYFLVLLRRGPAWTAEETPETKKIFEGHMANIEAMGKSGKLVLAGPIDADPTDKTAIAGIFVFDVPARTDVEALLANDPAVKIGRLVPEILPWYSAAGITYPGKATP